MSLKGGFSFKTRDISLNGSGRNPVEGEKSDEIRKRMDKKSQRNIFL